ncbi:MAG TPA: NUDIX hydrolase [Kineosporiaceae bacterium]|nr:NUDIX hydrolase [Kineosporiaceae bacterium]
MLRQFPLGRSADAVTGSPSPARPAATVMLVRDPVTLSPPGGPGNSTGTVPGAGTDPAVAGVCGGVEVFVFRRVAGMQFAAGMHVFPGGRVDERDGDPAVAWHGPGPEEFAAALSADVPLARALVVAAVRETFEECGVLLAGTPDGGPVPGLAAGEWGGVWADRQRRLSEGRIGLAELLSEAGLVLRAELLRPWAHWVTPPAEGRRYDTRFFVAGMPPGQQARDLGGEGEQARWLSAAAAVGQCATGAAPMLPPTVVCLEELAAAGSVSALLAAPRRIRPVMPWVVPGPDGRLLVEVDLDGSGGGEPRS